MWATHSGGIILFALKVTSLYILLAGDVLSSVTQHVIKICVTKVERQLMCYYVLKHVSFTVVCCEEMFIAVYLKIHFSSL
jgi:hypothetical protein